MIKGIVPTTFKYKLADDSQVDLLVNFSAMATLREKRRDLYNKFNKTIMTTDANTLDILDMTEVIYAGYIMNFLYYQQEGAMSFEAFLECMNFDLEEVVTTYTGLMKGNKKKASQKASKVELTLQKED